MKLPLVNRLAGAVGSARVLALGTMPGAASAQEEEKVLNIYDGSDDIADDTIANFEKETGIKVRHDVFDGNEIRRTMTRPDTSFETGL